MGLSRTISKQTVTLVEHRNTRVFNAPAEGAPLGIFCNAETVKEN